MKTKKLGIDTQRFSKGKNVWDAILDINGTGIPCDHKYQLVEVMGEGHYQVCCNKRCERKLFVR